MSDAPRSEYLEQAPEEEEEHLGPGGFASTYIPDAADVAEGAVDFLAEPVVEATLEAGGTLIEGVVDVVGDVIGSVLGSIFD